MYVTYTRIYGWSDYGGESSYQPGYRLENMMWMTLLVYDYIIPGEKSTYADALWIDTVLPISQIERYIEKSGVAEPSNISFVGDSDECGNYKVWIIAQEENNPHIIELTDRKKIDHMIILYWD